MLRAIDGAIDDPTAAPANRRAAPVATTGKFTGNFNGIHISLFVFL